MVPTPYTLYYSSESLCSYMVRYSIAIRGPGKDGVEISVEEKEVDIHYKLEQLSESYLSNVNAKGKVPTLTSPALSSPLPDSKEITNYLATKFPNLKPTGYETQIDEVLNKIHAPLPYFILSFGGHKAASAPKGVEPTIRRALEREDISTGYRRALEYKLTLHTGSDLDDVLGLESVARAETQMREFLEYVDDKLPSSQGWLFGLPDPSAADAHLVALLVRMHDVGRDHLFPPKVKEYGERARRTKEWLGVMKGLETTMCQG